MSALAPFRCALCPQIFARFAAYADHVQAWHGGRGAYLCDFCRRAFPNYAQWDEHQGLDHREMDAPKTLPFGPRQVIELARSAEAGSEPQQTPDSGVRFTD